MNERLRQWGCPRSRLARKMYDFGAEKDTIAHNGRDFISSVSTGNSGWNALSGVRSTEATVWGLGMVQNFNNAATEWYLGYRNYGLSLNSDAYCSPAATTATVPGSSVSLNGPGTSAQFGPGAGVACKIQDMNLLVSGLRVKF